jgi:hypothetical protein
LLTVALSDPGLGAFKRGVYYTCPTAGIRKFSHESYLTKRRQLVSYDIQKQPDFTEAADLRVKCFLGIITDSHATQIMDTS